eukprot:scaffold111315_cov75-Phaeocystis_antarctica.AAC.6
MAYAWHVHVHVHVHEHGPAWNESMAAGSLRVRVRARRVPPASTLYAMNPVFSIAGLDASDTPG